MKCHVGEPVYDKGECIGYLVSQLEQNGFHVKYVHPQTLFVSWHNWIPYISRTKYNKSKTYDTSPGEDFGLWVTYYYYL